MEVQKRQTQTKESLKIALIQLLQTKDSGEIQQIMGEIMKIQNLRNELAKKTGTNILV